MKTFGNTLKDLLTKKNLHKTNFAKSIHIQRSTLYKYIDGTTLPDETLLEDMKKKLNLSEKEFQSLDEAYLTSKFGKGTLRNRQTIHKILEEMSQFYNNRLNNNQELLTFTSFLPDDLKSFLKKLFTSTTEFKKILLNTNQSEAVTELLKFIVDRINKNFIDITIEHIFHYKSIENVHESINNLQFLSDISTVISSYEKYNPFFYSITTSHDTYNIFPNTLLINNTIIYISNDFKNWFYIDEKNNPNIYNIATYFCKEFSKAKIQTSPLIKLMRDMPPFLEFILDIENKSITEYGFRKDFTCFGPPPNMELDWFDFDPNLIDETYLKLIIDLHNNRLKNFVCRLNNEFKYFCISSYKSTYDFLNKGRIYDQGEYPTFKIEARIKIIVNLIYYLCKYDNFNIYLIKDEMMSNFPFIDKIQLCTNDSTLMISICDENSEICQKQPFVIAMALDSPEIAHCFNDYIYSLTRNMTISKEESILLIKTELDNFALKNNIPIHYDEIILNYIDKIKNTAFAN